MMKLSLQMLGNVPKQSKATTVSKSEVGFGRNAERKLGLSKPPLSKNRKYERDLRRESLPSDLYSQTVAGRPGISQETGGDTMAALVSFERDTHKAKSRHISPKPERTQEHPVVAEIKPKGPLEIQPVLHLRRIESKELMRSDSDEDAKLPIMPHTHRPSNQHKPQFPHITEEYDPPLPSERLLSQAMRKLVSDYNLATAAVLNDTQTRFKEVPKIPQRLLNL